MTVQLFGIRSCDTMRKAMAWLEAAGVPYTLRDYKKEGADPDAVRRWVERLGWDTVLNRAGTTFRQLPEVDRTKLDADKAVALMLAQPSMIRRPMLVHGDLVEAGFKPDRYAALFG